MAPGENEFDTPDLGSECGWRNPKTLPWDPGMFTVRKRERGIEGQREGRVRARASKGD